MRLSGVLLFVLAALTVPPATSLAAAVAEPSGAALTAPPSAAETPDSALAASHRPWSPADAAPGPSTRADAGFHGVWILDPIRLHLSRGGFAEGALGGVDRARGAVLLVEPDASLWVDLSLLSAVSLLGASRPQRDGFGDLLPEPLPRSDPAAVRYVLRPTWRSHVGVLLSTLLPGTGQFIQEENRRVGWIFLAAWTFVVAAGVLALVSPAWPPTQERATIAATFFGVGLAFNVTAAIHAFQQGRRRVPVPRRVGR